MMLIARTTSVAARTLIQARPQTQQKRTFIKWMVNYPDKVMEMKKLQQKGGTMVGQDNPTWLKQPQDKLTAAACLFLTSWGMWQICTGHWNMAHGINKMED